MGYFTGKRVWITGASSGIGEGLAREFAAQGARVILSARSADRLEEIASELKEARVLPLDLSDLSSLSEKAQTALSYWGGLDIMVHNGGIGQRSTALNTPFENTRRIMDVNFLSTTILTREILPAMRENSIGQFLIISSLMGKFGAPGRSSYAASKHALQGYYEALRAEEWNYGIRVTIAVPGYVQTSISRHALEPDGSEHGKLDPGQEKGMPTDACARVLLKALEKQTDEVLVGGPEKYSVLLKRWAPAILTRILRGKNID
jgi:short-subunit dehydrogenase